MRLNSDNYILNRKCAFKNCNLLEKNRGTKNKFGQLAREKYCSQHIIFMRGKDAVEKEKLRQKIKLKKYIKRYNTDKQFRLIELKKRQKYNNTPEIKERERLRRLTPEYKERKKKQYLIIKNDPIKYKKLRKYLNNWEKNKKQNDLNFRVKKLMSSRIREALKSQKVLKDERTINLLGTNNIQKVRKNIEKQFLFGMSWSNHGVWGWHIDHIIPLSSFNLKKKKEQKKAFNYKNLQPLWAEDNLSKGNKIIQKVL